MKTIRRGVFETNSSSEHSVTVGEEIFALPKAQYEQFKDGKAFFDKLTEQFITGKQALHTVHTNAKYLSHVLQAKCEPISLQVLMDIVNGEYYWSTESYIKHLKKAWVTKYGLTEDLVKIIRGILRNNSWSAYKQFQNDIYADSVDYIEKEIKINRNTIVIFGYAYGNGD